MADRIKIAVVGCGEHSLENLVPSLWSNRLAEIVAFCDPGPDERGRAAELVPWAQRFSSFDAMLDECAIDAVVAAAPPQVHCELARRAMAAGIHVFLEKPPAAHSAELEKLAEDAERFKVTAMVGHNLRYSNASVRMKSEMSEASFGVPEAMEVRYFASKPRGDRWNLSSPVRSFLLSHVSHAIDFMVFHVGDLSEVSACADTSPNGSMTVAIHLKFRKGGVGTLLATNNCPHFSVQGTIIGSGGGYVRMDSLSSVTTFGTSGSSKRNGRIWVEQELNSGSTHAGYFAELDMFLRGIVMGTKVAPSLSDELTVFRALDDIEAQISAVRSGGLVG
jgi:predicted dehydrogenase